jgi:hypothetical protein
MSEGSPILNTSPGGKKRRLDRVTNTSCVWNVLQPIITSSFRSAPTVSATAVSNGVDASSVPDGGSTGYGGRGVIVEEAPSAYAEGGLPVNVEQSDEHRGPLFTTAFRSGTADSSLDEPEDSAAFDAIRSDLRDRFVEGFCTNKAITETRKNLLERTLLEIVGTHNHQCSLCLSSEVQQSRTVTVLWVGSAYRFEIEVPVWHCIACQECFTINPVEASCMPATAVQGWDLTKVPANGRALWFDLALVQVSQLTMFSVIFVVNAIVHSNSDRSTY